MFLFLSKLLPLLVYPLGFSLLLLAIAAFLFKRRRGLARVLVALAFGILWASSTPLVTDTLVRSLEEQNLPTVLPPAEAIIVLGGATKSANAPRPWVDVRDEGDRVLHAAQLYRQGKAPKIILSGGRIGWQGDGRAESSDMAELLEFMNVPRSAMLEDPGSLNTRQNAENVLEIVEREGIRGPMLLVTSAFHMPRSLAIFRKLNLDVVPAPTDFLYAEGDSRRPSPQARLLSLLPDVENLRTTTRMLKEYIGMVVYRLKGWI